MMKRPTLVSGTLETACLGTLMACGGFYEAPSGGPLVGYAGRYQANDGSMKQYVGRVYANFAKAEVWPRVRLYFADMWAGVCKSHGFEINDDMVFMGMPMGGIKFADAFADLFTYNRSINLDKKITALETSTSREESELVFGRYELEPGDKVVIVEDVCNNFSTTAKALKLIESVGAEVVAIGCILNRSPETVYEVAGPNIAFGLPDQEIPVISVVHKPFPQYRQDDPEVAADIAAGNVVWKPKNKEDWARLEEIMYSCQSGDESLTFTNSHGLIDEAALQEQMAKIEAANPSVCPDCGHEPMTPHHDECPAKRGIHSM